jgi:hypothetical protein
VNSKESPDRKALLKRDLLRNNLHWSEFIRNSAFIELSAGVVFIGIESDLQGIDSVVRPIFEIEDIARLNLAVFTEGFFEPNGAVSFARSICPRGPCYIHSYYYKLNINNVNIYFKYSAATFFDDNS